MSIESKLSGHWTDEQIIDYLYGIGPEDNHLAICQECHARMAAMQTRRQALEEMRGDTGDVSFSFLAAQRRKIYSRLEQPVPWWSSRRALRWASGAAALVVVGGGLSILEQQHSVEFRHASLPTASLRDSDAQLAEEVSSLATSPEPFATAPLKALFAE
jgi:anti-sigma factor RsiW